MPHYFFSHFDDKLSELTGRLAVSVTARPLRNYMLCPRPERLGHLWGSVFEAAASRPASHQGAAHAQAPCLPKLAKSQIVQGQD